MVAFIWFINHVNMMQLYGLISYFHYRYNDISKLEDNTFICLGNLSVLSLKKNELADLSSEKCFQGLGSLKTLYLTANHIHTVSPEVRIFYDYITGLSLIHGNMLPF